MHTAKREKQINMPALFSAGKTKGGQEGSCGSLTWLPFSNQIAAQYLRIEKFTAAAIVYSLSLCPSSVISLWIFHESKKYRWASCLTEIQRLIWNWSKSLKWYDMNHIPKKHCSRLLPQHIVPFMWINWHQGTTDGSSMNNLFLTI